MTTYNKTSLKTFFETGDVPGGQQYADFIDSCVNVAETAVQTMTGALNPTELITAVVSAGNGVFTGNLSVGGTFSAGTISVNNIDVSAAAAVRVSAVTINATGDISTSAASVYASAMRAASGFYTATAIVSATGITQGTAAALTAPLAQGAGIIDGSSTGFLLLRNRQGYQQAIINGAASANLWPGADGRINALTTNAAFPMAANTPYIIYHIGASAYAVK